MAVAHYTLLVEYTVQRLGEHVHESIEFHERYRTSRAASRLLAFQGLYSVQLAIYFINGLLNYKNEDMASVKFVICLS